MKDRSISSSRRKIIKEQRIKRKKKQQRNTLLIIIGIALIISALLIYPTLRQTLTPVGEIVKITPYPRPMVDFNAMGNPDAPVKIEEFSDFQCPYCKKFSDEAEKLIVDNYIATGKVYFVYIPYGPTGEYIGPESKDSALASFCAAEQGKFWEYHDIIFANHSGENVGDYTEKRLMAFAETLELDMDSFRSCYIDEKYEQRLAEGIAYGKSAGIGPTPSFLINGKIIEGAQPYSSFQQAIEAALAEAGGD